jgi:prolyl-tRNA synthetase
MGKPKNKLTPQAENFSQWYQDVVKEAELAENSQVRGCGIVRPYGMKIWDLIKAKLAQKIEATGAENVYFPVFVPMENLQAEKDHVEGFSPELAVVTHGGGEKLVNELAVRPTSEAAMYPAYARWIQSYKDLPLRLNQWNNVIRWEKRPRPFLRWSEFLWQEGHTVFATREEALAEMWQMLDIYKETYQELGIPVFEGKKSAMETFAGADITTTVEVMARDGKAIQGATSHHLGTSFAKVFGVKYRGQDEQEHYCHQNSWGFAWRSVGALIMAHGNDKGLRLPPAAAPFEIVIVPIFQEENKAEILEFAEKIKKALSKQYRVKVDDREGMSPGFKFNHWELKGAPVRLEIGQKEIETEALTLFRRDLEQKEILPLHKMKERLKEIMQEIPDNLYRQATDFTQNHIHRIESLEEIKNQKGFFEASWCESEESEKLLKEKFQMVSRVLPKENEGQKPKNPKCFITGQSAKHDWLFAKSY